MDGFLVFVFVLLLANSNILTNPHCDLNLSYIYLMRQERKAEAILGTGEGNGGP